MEAWFTLKAKKERIANASEAIKILIFIVWFQKTHHQNTK